MTIETRTSGPVTILDIHGKITIGEGSAEVRKIVRELLQAGKTDILLNLGDVSYVDSSGIGELVSSFTPTFTIWDPKIACLNRSKLL